VKAKVSPIKTSVTIDLNIKLKAALPEGEQLHITGSLPELGNWDPEGVPLSPDSNGLYQLQLSAERGSIIECKLTRGTWKTQGIYDPDVVPPDNFVIKAGKNKKINITILDWLDKQILESDPVRGKLLSYNGLACKKLKYQRSVQIWLPESYSEKAEPCAVIYMHDSQNLFEPATSFAGVDWKVDETISEMIEAGEIRPCIVVGIPNSPARMKELNMFTAEGKAYGRFIVDEVKPFIEGKFNVSGKPADNCIMGSSMGGLMSLQMLLAYNDKFSMAGCLSSAFQKTGDKIFAQVRNAETMPLDAKLYLDTGEFEPPIAESFFAMVELLQEKGYREQENLFAYLDEGATHSESAWARRLRIPLKYLLGKN
jgi:predicted alpha/beta superfamily hydrolase